MLPLLLMAVLLAAATYVDAAYMVRTRLDGRRVARFEPWSWAVFVLLLWPVAVPWYVVMRVRLTVSDSYRDSLLGVRSQAVAATARPGGDPRRPV